MASGPSQDRPAIIQALIMALRGGLSDEASVSLLSPIIPLLAAQWRLHFGTGVPPDISVVDPNSLMKFAEGAITFLYETASGDPHSSGNAQGAVPCAPAAVPAAEAATPELPHSWGTGWDQGGVARISRPGRPESQRCELAELAGDLSLRVRTRPGQPGSQRWAGGFFLRCPMAQVRP